MLDLFLAFLRVGLLSIGGGYAALPFIQQEIVTRTGWLTMEEFSSLIAIAEMTPGPMAVNSATFVGMRLYGIPGALVASLGCILPSLFIVTGLHFLFKRFGRFPVVQQVLGFLRPIVVALIASAFLTILINALFPGGLASLTDVLGIDIRMAVLAVGAFFAIRKWKWNPILTMLLCGGCYLVLGVLLG